MTDSLTDDEKQLLAIAAADMPLRGQRGHAIHEQLGMTPTQYWQRVNVLLDDIRALEHDPHLVYRLRRIRGPRSRRRLPAASVAS